MIQIDRILQITGDLQDIKEQRELLATAFLEAKERKERLVISTDRLSIVPEAVEMWVGIAEQYLGDIEVHYLFSQLSLVLGYNEDYIKAHPKHTYAMTLPLMTPPLMAKFTTNPA